MPEIKGVIYSPTGKPQGGVTITLTSLHNRSGILKGVFSHVTTHNGQYNFFILPGIYRVSLSLNALRPVDAGVIRIYDDSEGGSLNDFLGEADIDLRPEALRKYEALLQQAQQCVAEAKTLLERLVTPVATDSDLPENPEGFYLVEADATKGGGPQIYYYPGDGR
ncbi:TPA: prophage tail fiber N-terminal domain-containing protein, partial [Escherichia coli]|nr:prophage tail fiber N-terminal domain-containing protein [Escherichia coli]HAY0228611.1 hypothetical protein [Escherichia coli]HEM0035914.1 prophage tail fiber N-terminal domain-containing protein [Escherichia coli]